LPRALETADVSENRTLVLLSSPFEHDYEKTAPGLKIATESEYENDIDGCVGYSFLLCTCSEKSGGK
jgi:hypothetical protein